MTPRALTLIGHDARLQYRYGIYVAYAFVVVFYIAALVGGRALLPPWAVALIIFTDPAAVGFFFLGALMMLEKAERVRAAFAVSPVSPADYLVGKTVTLTTVALAASAIIMVVAHDVANPALLLVAVVLTSVAYVGIGIPIALRFKTVNGYLVGSSGFLIPVIAPGFLALLDPTPLLVLVIPAAAQFKLILVAIGAGTADAIELSLALGISAAAAAGAMWLALHFLRKELGR